MSTHWYLECGDHNPPLRSDSAVEQHTSGLPAIREFINEHHGTLDKHDDLHLFEYYERAAAYFIVKHPTCNIGFVSEYGTREHLNPDQPAPTRIIEPAIGMVVVFDKTEFGVSGRFVASYIPGFVEADGTLADLCWTDPAGDTYTLEQINAGNPEIITTGIVGAKASIPEETTDAR